jgi:PKD repeat protein
MKGFLKAVLAVIFLAQVSTVLGQSQLTVAEYVDSPLSVVTSNGQSIKRQEFSYPGSSFVKVHFSDFRLPPGMIIEVRNPSGSESYSYSRDHRDGFTFNPELGDDGESSFYAMSISGDTAVIQVHGKPGFIKSAEKAARGRVFIDHVVRGFAVDSEVQHRSKSATSTLEVSSRSFDIGSGFTESTCGLLERYDAICWAGTDPAAYDRSRPVAKAIIGIKSCTAWRVGSNNHMFTNNHCAASRGEVSAMEVWFNYEKTVCGGDTTEQVVKVSGDKLIATDYTLDYTLFSINDFASVESFGNLGLEVRDAERGELIYIPQHGSGDPKQIAIESDMNVGGLCQVDDESLFGRDEGTDIGYFCDTIGGSSGSPVVLTDTNKAIALHHQGGCYNSGVKMSLIWPKVARHFGRIVPEGDFDPGIINPPDDPEPDPDPDPDTPPVAQFGFVCTYLDCAFDGSGSYDADGPLASYAWNFGDSSSASESIADHSFAAEGSYTVTLTVVDSMGSSDSETKTLSVSAPPVENQAPIAEFTFICSALTCSFDAGASNDPDGSIIAFNWSFEDGVSGSGPVTDHVFQSEGSYTVSLEVVDDQGATSEFADVVTVQADSQVVGSIELTAVGTKERGKKWADLSWRGSEASQVRIFRDDLELTTQENTGAYRDSAIDNPVKSAIYRVCDTDESVCSNEVEVTF